MQGTLHAISFRAQVLHEDVTARFQFGAGRPSSPDAGEKGGAGG